MEIDGFGLPAPDDPDPFGVLALERAGLEIKEIKEEGLRSRPSSDAFEYKPSPTSPIFANFARQSWQSIDTVSQRNSRRNSRRSTKSVDHGTQTMVELGTPTIEESPRENSPPKKATEDLAWIRTDDDDAEEEEFEDEPEAIIEEATIEEASPAVQFRAHAAASTTVTGPKLVNIQKRIPPALPPRSPYRRRVDKGIGYEPKIEEGAEENADDGHSSTYTSPAKSTFDRDEAESPNPWSSDEVTSIPEMESPEMKGVPNTIYEDEVNGKKENGLEGPATTIRDNLKEMEHKDDTPVEDSASVFTEVPLNEGEKAANESEEFHSMPSTPLESQPTEMKVVGDQDFS